MSIVALVSQEINTFVIFEIPSEREQKMIAL